MYDPTSLARYYALRAQGFLSLANEESSISHAIYRRLAEMFERLAASADRFAAELRGEAPPLEQGKEEPETPIHVPVPSRSKRKRALRKPPLAQAQLTDAAVIDELRH